MGSHTRLNVTDMCLDVELDSELELAGIFIAFLHHSVVFCWLISLHFPTDLNTMNDDDNCLQEKEVVSE